MSTIFEFFLRAWRVESSEKEIFETRPEIIIPVSYVTGRKALTRCTSANMARAISWGQNLRTDDFNPIIVWSPCSYVFPGASITENTLRIAEIRQKDYSGPWYVASPMQNTVEEALRIKEKLDNLQLAPERILLCTGELHSRSAQLVWRKVFPNSRILISCTEGHLETQADHPVPNQRHLWSWTISNVLRYLALQLTPLTWVAKIRHRV